MHPYYVIKSYVIIRSSRAHAGELLAINENAYAHKGRSAIVVVPDSTHKGE
jgi:hypothetical protein